MSFEPSTPMMTAFMPNGRLIWIHSWDIRWQKRVQRLLYAGVARK